LTPKPALPGRDELVGLTHSFAAMTQPLATARAAVASSIHERETARAELQTILDNLTAGVIVLNPQGLIQSSNPGATRILRAPLAARAGHALAELSGLQDFGREVQRQFDELEGERRAHGPDYWQKSFELHGHAGAGGGDADAVVLLARGAGLPGGLRLLVFDDISEIASAQRAQAWGEVARRLAHEIKNPLTPIQLSAERLQGKLAGHLPEAERAVLAKAVRTIVDQVDGMKRLVNEFRDYARLPAARLQPLDLNTLAAEVLQLYGAGADGAAGHDAGAAVRLQADAACPPILGDAQQLRQVIHNLIQNSLDAAQQRPGAAAPHEPSVIVRTQWLPDAERVRLSVLDHGPGFTDALLRRAFEPYVTTKVKGTGLGLAVVKKIADEHHARVDVSNRMDGARVVGAQVSLSLAIAPVAAGQPAASAPDQS
jgi:nitrogen fixation/metabolism regulation signal transduction histidine kinase